MYATTEKAVRLLDEAASSRTQADRVWRSAIRDALASSLPVEQVAVRARTTVDTVLTVVNEHYAERAY